MVRVFHSIGYPLNLIREKTRTLEKRKGAAPEAARNPSKMAILARFPNSRM
jgi:hypothetical protein